MWTSTGQLRDPVTECPGDEMMGRSNDGCNTSLKHVF